MSQFDYLPFDLLIDRVGTRFRARVLSSPAGEGTHLFTLAEIPPYFDQQTGRRTLASLQAFGGNLFAAVFGGQVGRLFDLSLAEGLAQKKGLRVLLRLAEVPRLATLPWEYLYDRRHQRFLTLSKKSVLTRYLALPERNRPFAIQSPLRILAVLASPFDQPPLQVEQEWQSLQTALSGLVERGLVEVERLEQATIVALQQKLRQNSYHIFHFVGHGGFDKTSQAGFLRFEAHNRRSHLVSAHDLGQLLYDHQSLCLVFLNACKGGQGSSRSTFSGVASVLMRQGIPAVIGMQFDITDQAAVVFAAEFYRALADEYPLEGALTEARRAVYYQANQIEWGTAVLHMRAPGGHFLALANPATTSSTSEERYLDAAIPNQVLVGKSTELVAMIRLPSSAGLRAYLKDQAQIEAQAKDVKSNKFSLEFPPDKEGKPAPLELYIDLETDDFQVPTKRKKIRVQPGKDTAVTIFRLIPRKSGALKLLLQVFLSGETLLASDFVKVKGFSKLNQAFRSTINLISLSLGSFGLGSDSQKEGHQLLDHTATELNDITAAITEGRLLVFIGPILQNDPIFAPFSQALQERSNILLQEEEQKKLLNANHVKQDAMIKRFKKMGQPPDLLLLGYDLSDPITTSLLHVIRRTYRGRLYLVCTGLSAQEREILEKKYEMTIIVMTSLRFSIKMVNLFNIR